MASFGKDVRTWVRTKHDFVEVIKKCLESPMRDTLADENAQLMEEEK
jgi:hypothetical protein